MLDINFAKTALRSTAVWLGIIFAETLNGTVRELLLVSSLGTANARVLSFISAVILISLISYASIGWIAASSQTRLIAVGVWWAVLTFVFEVTLGLALGTDRETMAREYDPRQGGMMLIGLGYLIIVPTLAYRLRQAQRRAPSAALRP